MNKTIFLILVLISFVICPLDAQIVLTHNVGDNVVDTGMFSCPEQEQFARTFTLQDFGIPLGSEFEISSGQFGIFRSYGGAIARFNIYSIDANFPDSFNESNLIGGSQFINIPWVFTSSPQILSIAFDNPIIIPDTVSRILVEVEKIDNPNEIAVSTTSFAGTIIDNDLSWYNGCGGGFINNYGYVTTLETSIPKPNAKFYIKVNGEISSGIQVNNNCLGDVTNFTINTNDVITNVAWDFGDGNSASMESPTHQYNSSGNFLVGVSYSLNGETIADSKTITIYEPPILNNSVALSQCDMDLDGIATFNLFTSQSLIYSGVDDVTLSFYDSELEAVNDENAIQNPESYLNTTAFSQMLWVKVTNNFNCYSITSINLNVSASQILNNFSTNIFQCDDDLNPSNGVTTFDLTSIEDEVALEIGNSNILITYFENDSDAFTNENEIATPENYTNVDPITQVVWLRIEDVSESECLSIGPYLTLHVQNVPLVTGPIIVEQCDLNTDGEELFDTSNFENELSEGQTESVTFTYKDENGNLLPSPLPNPFLTTQPITNITVTIFGEEGDNPNRVCEVTTNIALIITTGFNVGNMPDYFGCAEQSGNEGYTFDVSDLESSILDGQSNLLISFFDVNGDLMESPFPSELILNESTTITAVINSSLDPMCLTELDINFTVAKKPAFWQLDNVSLCFEEGEEQIFDLRTYLENGLAESMFEDVQITAYNNGVLLDDIIDVDFNNDIGGIISYRIQNIEYPDCYTVGEFNIISSVTPSIVVLNDIIECDDLNNDGTETFNLELKNDEILNGLSSDNFTVMYFESYNDAIENVYPLTEIYNNITNPQTIYTRLSFTDNLDCYDVSSFDIVVRAVPDLSTIQDEYFLCTRQSFEVTAGDGLDYYFWSTGATTSSITITEPGQYTITALRAYADLSCEVSKTFTVNSSNVPDQIEVIVSDWSLSNNSIEVLAEGIGDYEYSLDGITYQNSNVFYDLSVTDNVVYVRDKNGCGVVEKAFYLLNYPRFFTPNQDYKNDYWQLYNSYEEPSNIIYIFNRYGKLLLQLDPMSRGWDGTFNGANLPSDDYWFVLERQNGDRHTGHFALLR